MSEKEYKTKDIGKVLAKKQKKPVREPFSKLVHNRTFEVTDFGTTGEGLYFWCAFCGGRGRHYIEITRNDKKKLKVGKTCLHKVGLDLPPELVAKKNPNVVPIESTNGDKAVPKVKNDPLDDEIEQLLKTL